MIDKRQNWSTYTVQRLRDMKRQHEEKYRNGISQLWETMERQARMPIDVTAQFIGEQAPNIARLVQILELPEDDAVEKEYNEQYMLAVNKLQEVLSKIPLRVRSTLAIILKYGTGDPIEISWHELTAHTVNYDDSNVRDIQEDVRVLNKNGIATGPYENIDDVLMISLREPRVFISDTAVRWDDYPGELGYSKNRDEEVVAGYGFWRGLKEIVDGDDELLREMIHGADFTALSGSGGE
ncbi:hypothetical protein [Rhodococcus sp. T7]|uniref:hypothetical protein n=1 Tax=Rhodococcus sp. T7 TaxID=627444 RepID=UPI001356C5D2|nr:hypothetical protein [Rhodococcus sp. T7]